MTQYTDPASIHSCISYGAGLRVHHRQDTTQDSTRTLGWPFTATSTSRWCFSPTPTTPATTNLLIPITIYPLPFQECCPNGHTVCNLMEHLLTLSITPLRLMSTICSFMRLSRVPWQDTPLSDHLPANIWVIPSVGVLQIKRL